MSVSTTASKAQARRQRDTRPITVSHFNVPPDDAPLPDPWPAMLYEMYMRWLPKFLARQQGEQNDAG